MGRTTGRGWSRGTELGSAHPKLFTWGSLAFGGFLRYHRTVFFVCLGVGVRREDMERGSGRSRGPVSLRGTRWNAPLTSLFGAVRPAAVGSRAVSAGASARGAGWARPSGSPSRSPARPATPGLQRRPLRPRRPAPPAGRAPHSPARSPRALRPVGRVPETL